MINLLSASYLLRYTSNIQYRYKYTPTAKVLINTGGVQIIGRILRFSNYFVTINKKNTGENTQRSKVNSSSRRQTEYTFCLEIQSIKLMEEIRLSISPAFGVLSAHIAPYYRKQCYYECKT